MSLADRQSKGVEMLRGELGPEPLRWYTKPIVADLRYEDIVKDPFPTPEEAQVWFRLGEKLQSAFVPLFVVDEENGTVRAALLGEQGAKIYVSFPPTNFGQTRFFSSEDNLAKIAMIPT